MNTSASWRKTIKIDANNLTITFTLQENVKFHNGKDLTSADAKYTLDALFQSGGYKAASFYDTVDGAENQAAHYRNRNARRQNAGAESSPSGLDQSDAFESRDDSDYSRRQHSNNRKLRQSERARLNSSASTRRTISSRSKPIPNYWEGAPKIQKVIVKTVTDANALQAELQAGRR